MALRRGKDPLNEIQTCLQKRDYKGALPYFLTLLEKSSKNTQIRLRYADTLVLAGSKKEAIKQYTVVADELAEAGFIVRAIAINKKIVQLDPSQVAVNDKVARMNEERSKSGFRMPPLVGSLTSPNIEPPSRDLPFREAPITRPHVEPPSVPVVMTALESWDMEFGSEAPPLTSTQADTTQDQVEAPLVAKAGRGAVATGPREDVGTYELIDEPTPEPLEARSDGVIEIDMEPAGTSGVGFAEMSRPSAGSPEPSRRGGSPELMRDGGGAPSHAGKAAPRHEPDSPEPIGRGAPRPIDDPFAGAPREIPTAGGVDGVLVPESPELDVLELIPEDRDEEDVATRRSVGPPPPKSEDFSSGFSLADETPSARGETPSEPPFELGDVGLGREVASHFQAEDPTEPAIDLEPEVVMEDAEPPSSPGAAFTFDFGTQPDEAADGANPLVGLIGEDVDSLIDNIISDVSSSRGWEQETREEPPTKIPLFSDLTTEEFIDVALMLNRRPVKAGAVIVQEGDPGDSMFIVSTGEVSAVREEGGRQVHLATLRDGDFFGEMAVLSREPRRATVVAVKNSELLELSRDHLLEIFARHPHVEAKIRLAHDERLMT